MRTSGCVGIDLGSGGVRVVEANERGDLLRKLNLRRDRPGETYDADEIDRLVDALRRQGFEQPRTEVVLPRALLRSSIVELPPADSGAPIEQIARSQIAHDRGIDPGGFELAIWHASSSAQSSPPAIVVTSEHDETGPIAEGFERAGVELLGLRAPESALAEIVRHVEGPGANIALDLGWACASISLVEAGQVRFARTLPSFGFEKLASRLAERLSVGLYTAGELLSHSRRSEPAIAGHASELLRPHGLQLAQEIADSIEYIRRTWPELKRVRVNAVGGGADDSDMTDFLTISAGLVVAPLSMETVSGVLPPVYAAAAGAAVLGTNNAGEAAA